MFARASTVLLLFLFAMILFTSHGSSQPQPPPGGGGKKGGGGGKAPGKGQFDPADRFKELAKGRDYFMVGEANPQIQGDLGSFARQQGINDGKITYEVFTQFWQQRFANGIPGFGQKGGGKKGGGGGPTGGGKPSQKPPEPSPAELAKMAEEDFKKLDRNGNGVLEYDEMPSTLQRELADWDKNRDYVIDLKEYIGFYLDQAAIAAQQGAQAETSNSGRMVIEDDLERRPVVYRYGKLPKELPEWFGEVDANRDGLVSLGEWRKAEKSFEDFKSIDRNNDGLLTAEEVLRFQAGEETEGGSTQTAGMKGSAPSRKGGGGGNPSAGPSSPPNMGQPPSGGGFPPGKGKGFPGGGGGRQKR